jgi:hypothetical protein
VTRAADGSDRSGSLTSAFSRLAKLRRVVRRGEIALRNGDLDTAERAGRRVLDQLGTDSVELASSRPEELHAMIVGLELIACVRRELTDFVGCAELHRQALAALDMVPAGADRDQLRLPALVRLGELRLLGQFPEAEDVLKRAMQLADSHHPPDPINLASALNGLGIVFKDTHDSSKPDSTTGRLSHCLNRPSAPTPQNLLRCTTTLAGLEHAQDQFVQGENLSRGAHSNYAKPTKG